MAAPSEIEAVVLDEITQLIKRIAERFSISEKEASDAFLVGLMEWETNRLGGIDGVVDKLMGRKT